jgi:hypothetical protein
MDKKFYLITAVFIVIGFIIYSPGITSSRYGDDYTIVPERNISVFKEIWTTTYQRWMFFRPIEDSITTLFIFAFGWNTLPTHIFFILIHCTFSVFVYYVLLKLKLPRLGALFGALFMLVAQVNVTTVGGNDTLGQLISSSLSFLNLWIMYRAVDTSGEGKFINSRLYIYSLVIFALCLLTKESSAAFIPLLFLLLLIKIPVITTRSFADAKRILLLLVPYVIIFLVFFYIRSGIVPYKPGIGTGNYDFNIGLNIPKNIGMLIFSLLLPITSVRVFEAVQFKDYKFLMTAAFLAGLFGAMIFSGVWRSRKFKEALVIICFIIAGFFPPVLLNHVNEQYTYYSMPFAAMLIAIGLGYYTDNLKGALRTIFLSVLTVFFMLNSLSVMEKNALMKELGSRAEVLMEQVKPYFPAIPSNGSLVLVNPPTKELRYSAFKQPGFEPLHYTEFMMYDIAGRNDFTLLVIERNEIEKHDKPGSLLLTFDGEEVVRVK